MNKRSTNHNRTVWLVSLQHFIDLLYKFNTLLEIIIHLPVTSNNFLSHFSISNLLLIKHFNLSIRITKSSGSKNISTTFNTSLSILISGGVLKPRYSKGADRNSSSGIFASLHFLMITPSFINTSPGLDRIIVCSGISSENKNSYSAPVSSIQLETSPLPEAVTPYILYPYVLQ